MEKRLQDEKLLARHPDDASRSCLVLKANRKKPLSSSSPSGRVCQSGSDVDVNKSELVFSEETCSWGEGPI